MKFYKSFLTFIHISWINTGLFEVLILLYSLNVKNELECSGWSLETWVFRFDVGALLVDLMVWPDSHILHFQRSEKTLFFPLMASYRWKNSDKWANFCLNFSRCSSSAKIHCKIISVMLIIQFLKKFTFSEYVLRYLFCYISKKFVKNEAKISGWRFIWFFRFDVGALLADLMILPDWHILHFHRSEKILFCPLMASDRWKNSDKWANFCLNFESCSSSARIWYKIF